MRTDSLHQLTGRRAISAFLIATLATTSCITRSYNNPQSLEAQEGQYLFTTMPDPTFAGEGMVTNTSAGSKSGLRRFALRFTGIFLPKGAEQNGTLSAQDNLDGTMNFSRTCDSGGNCNFSLVTTGDGAMKCTASGKRDVLELYLPCMVTNPLPTERAATGIGVAIFNRHAIAGELTGSRIKPNTNLETFRTGPFYRGDDQSLVRVEKNRPVQFEVDEKLMQSEVFRSAYAKAANYWNSAAGLTLLSSELKSTSDFHFGFRRSLIKLGQPAGGTLARAHSLADPVSGTLLSLSVDVFELPKEDIATATSPSFSAILTHEIGHALGMAHNFAASFDPSTGEGNPTTSVMDYITNMGDLAKPKAYDVEFMRYVYHGEKPSGKLLHCNDVQTTYLLPCARYDVTRQTPEMLLGRLKDYSTPTPDVLEKFGEALEDILPSGALGQLLEPAKKGIPAAIAPLITNAPGLSVATIKELAFNETLSPELKKELVTALAARTEYLISKGKGISELQASWLRWLVEYAKAPYFTSKNRIELLKMLEGMQKNGFQYPHGPDVG